MSDNGFGSLVNGNDSPLGSREQIAETIRRLRQTAQGLPAELTPPDDLKILNQTLRELRRAFSVFAPYRSQRKVTIFGSARTPRDAPTYPRYPVSEVQKNIDVIQEWLSKYKVKGWKTKKDARSNITSASITERASPDRPTTAIR